MPLPVVLTTTVYGRKEAHMIQKRFDLFDGINYLFLILLSFTILYPFQYLLVLSFNTTQMGAGGKISLFPDSPTLENYARVFKSSFIWTGYMNTIIRTVLGTSLQLVATSLSAYVLAKKFFPHRTFWTFFIVFTMFFNGGLIPTYLLVRNLKLIDTYWAMILPQFIIAYNMILMRNYFMSLPEELEESCLIDGANWFIIFAFVIIPISAPIVATISLWIAVMHWNSWFDVLIYIRDEKLFTMQIVLRRIVLQGTQQMLDMNPSAEQDAGNFSSEGVKAATIFVATVLFYVFTPSYKILCQRNHGGLPKGIV
jgi:putative aldouronate transport system permease protein